MNALKNVAAEKERELLQKERELLQKETRKFDNVSVDPKWRCWKCGKEYKFEERCD